MCSSFPMQHPAPAAALPPRYRTAPSILVVLSVLFAVGCSDDAVVCPEDPIAPCGSASDLQTSFFVEPSMVQPGDSLVARLTISNPTSCMVTLPASCTSVAWLSVLQGTQAVAMQGAMFGCYPVITDFRIGPRDSLTRVYELVANVYAYPPGQWVPAPAGVYTLLAEMHVGLPDLQDDFVVVE
jgi:hypothetical protein